jgi:hypothetical protein
MRTAHCTYECTNLHYIMQCIYLPSSTKEVYMRYFIAALGLAFTLASGSVAFAADGWGNQHNGYGQYHVSNGS